MQPNADNLHDSAALIASLRTDLREARDAVLDARRDIRALLDRQRELRAALETAESERDDARDAIARMRGALKVLDAEANAARAQLPQRVAVAIDLLAGAHLESR